MEDTKKVKLLMILLLATSCLSAFCLGTLAFTMSTGELPFDLQVPEQFRSDIPEPQAKYKAAPLPVEERTPDELTLRELDDEMNEKLKSLDMREKKLKESEEALNQLISNAEDIKKKTEEVLTKIVEERKAKADEFKMQSDKIAAAQKALDESLSSTDAAIVKRIAGTLSNMQPTTSMILLADLDVKESARLLNFMIEAKRSQILEAMIVTNEVNGKTISQTDKLAFRKKANEIILELRQLKENSGGNTP